MAEFEIELLPIDTSGKISDESKKESDQLERGLPDAPPNSVVLNFGSFCKIRWHADSSAPLFCFVSISALLIFGIIVAIISAFNSSMTWPDEVFKFLGQAILTLVGAVVGASATAVTTSRSRKPPPRS